MASSSRDEKMKEIKSIVKSLVIPHQNGLEVRSLSKEYYELEGQQIPFRDFGFSSVADFLQSISDTVRFSRDRMGNVVLLPIHDETTAHIVELVQGQKRQPMKPPRSRPMYHPSLFHSMPTYQSLFTSRSGLFNPAFPGNPRTRIQGINRIRSSRAPTSTRRAPALLPSPRVPQSPAYGQILNLPRTPAPFMPNEVRAKLKGLLKEHHPAGVHLVYMTALYKIKYKENLDVISFGFRSIQDALVSIPEVCRLERQGFSVMVKDVVPLPTVQPQPEVRPLPVRSPPPVARHLPVPQPPPVVRPVPVPQPQPVAQPVPVPQSQPVARPMPQPVAPLPPTPAPEEIDWCDEAPHQRSMYFPADSVMASRRFESRSTVVDTVVTLVPRKRTPPATTSPATASASQFSPLQTGNSSTNSYPNVSSDASYSGNNFENSQTDISMVPTAVQKKANDAKHMSRVQAFNSIARKINLKDSSQNESGMQLNSLERIDPRLRAPSGSLTSEACSMRSQSANDTSSQDLDNFPTTVLQTFRRIMRKYEAGVPVCSFLKDYKKATGCDMDSGVWGIGSIVEVFYALPSIFYVTPPDVSNEADFEGFADDHILYDAQRVPLGVKDKEKQILTKNLKRKDLVGERRPIETAVQINILKIMLALGDSGISLHDFASLYFFNYNENLEPSKWGYKSMDEFLVMVSRDNPIEVRQNLEGSGSTVILREDFMKEWIKECASSSRVGVIRQLTDCQEDAVLPGTCYQQETIPQTEMSDPLDESFNWVPVVISSAVSPGCLWLQMKRNQKALDELMNDLDMYTLQVADVYKVPECFITVGFVCCAQFPADKNWHRVRITRVFRHRVIVLYVDYGGVSSVLKSDLRLLRQQFMRLPQQGVCASLYGVKYANSLLKMWDVKARNKVLEFSSANRDRYLACVFFRRASRKGEKSATLSVLLCDTSQDDRDSYVHEALIEAGLAAPMNEDEAIESLQNSHSLAQPEALRRPSERQVNQTQQTATVQPQAQAQAQAHVRPTEEATVSTSAPEPVTSPPPFDMSYDSSHPSFSWLDTLEKSDDSDLNPVKCNGNSTLSFSWLENLEKNDKQTF